MRRALTAKDRPSTPENDCRCASFVLNVVQAVKVTCARRNPSISNSSSSGLHGIRGSLNSVSSVTAFSNGKKRNVNCHGFIYVMCSFHFKAIWAELF